ncbi:krueppel-like factor 16 [Coprinopsis sp. MPI-PUGE-AT-0042]|nr:krueppel-like factor 16 [Coprinopsis sp. MPI-PUGE-AT-0042]
MDLQDQQGSPFIRGLGVVPPSPDHNHRTTDLESSFDGGSPNFIDASGSFNNSPYSNHSELSFVTAEGDLGGSGYDIFVEHTGGPQGLFEGLQSAGISAGTDYDPADYDGPSSASSLLMFNSDHDYYNMASPDLQGHHRQGSVPFDHSSPSSNGDPQDRRSRASSISSSYQGQQPSAHFNHSPRLDVAHSFENMTVRSPNWGTEGLPSQTKPQSPPRLMMPDNYGIENSELPTINAPEGDGVGGPQLHIVPATPIGTIGTGAPFDNALRQGSDQRQNWLGAGGPSQGVPSEPNSRQHSPYHLPVQLEPTTSQDSNFSNASSEFLFPQQRTRTNSGNAAWDQGMQQQQHLQRGGDGSGLGLDLDSMGHGGNLDDGVLGSGSSTTSMNMGSAPNSGGSPSFNNMQSFTFGGNSNTNLTANRDSNAYLSPNNNDAFMMRRSKSDQPNSRSLGHRQSRSEDVRGNGLLSAQQQQQIAVAQHAAQQQQAGWAQGQQQTFATGGGGGTHSHPHSPYHGHSLSLSASSGQMLFPPNQNDFTTMDNNLLLPTHQRNQRSHGGQGHIRRASSGSRSERGVGSEPWLTAYGSARASPYPSPNASPRVQYNAELELDLEREDRIEIPAAGNSAGFETEVALTGRVVGAGAGGAGLAGLLGPGGVGGHATHSPKSIDVNDFLGNASVSALNTLSAHGVSLGMGGGGMHGHHGSMDHKPPPVQLVSKPNVTTLRTANASHKRRKQDAGFMCPFPGCGSTFTRSFNLKGEFFVEPPSFGTHS